MRGQACGDFEAYRIILSFGGKQGFLRRKSNPDLSNPEKAIVHLPLLHYRCEAPFQVQE
jgi:hypothetical protein